MTEFKTGDIPGLDHFWSRDDERWVRVIGYIEHSKVNVRRSKSKSTPARVGDESEASQQALWDPMAER